MNPLHSNLHTHTHRCKHAKGDVADYCEAAIEKGLLVLGMSDHTPFPDDRWNTIRMDYAELPDYVAAIEQAQTDYPELKVLKGMECEYLPEFSTYFKDELLDAYAFDYLVAAVHYAYVDGEWSAVTRACSTKEGLHAYTKHFLSTVESGLFTFMAHPDLFGAAYPQWDAEAEACSREMLQCAIAHDLPIEINGNGFRKPEIDTPDGPRLKYPWFRFWELAAEYNVRVVTNSDSHQPDTVASNIDDGIALAEKYGLQMITLFDAD